MLRFRLIAVLAYTCNLVLDTKVRTSLLPGPVYLLYTFLVDPACDSQRCLHLKR